ncbi:hydroxymethylbilane synthase [bacterium]|nr:hydroxymethylbilane synthase [bacterium]
MAAKSKSGAKKSTAKKSVAKKATATKKKAEAAAKPASSSKKVATKKKATKKKSSPLGSFGRSAKATSKLSGMSGIGLDFIGRFPVRQKNSEKKNDQKKQNVGPVFPQGEYQIACRKDSLSEALLHEFVAVFKSKHTKDKLHKKEIPPSNKEPFISLEESPSYLHRHVYTRAAFDSLKDKEFDMLVINMKQVPLQLPKELTIAACLPREDPRDAMVTTGTYGAIQELPTNARIGANSRRRLMQIKALRPDIEIIEVRGDADERIRQLKAKDLSAVMLAWATLRRLNISPRYYVALQPEQMLSAGCQGIAGIICRSSDKELIEKLNYVDDSEASWASRCERAFLQKFGEFGDIPVGANAHRKGTQDPWILDAVIGDAESGEVLQHREIGTSRCKPESLADKAYVGVLAKGARKFLPFNF